MNHNQLTAKDNNSYDIELMEIIKGSYYNKIQTNENLHSLVLAIDLVKKKPETPKRYLIEFNKIYTQHIILKNKKNSLKNDSEIRNLDEVKSNDSEDIKFFFNIRYDKTKNNFDIEKINFKIENQVFHYLPNIYESIIKIDENENFVFYLAKKNNMCTGDLFISHKDRNLWTLSAKNLVLSQNEIDDNYEIYTRDNYLFDFSQVIFFKNCL